MKLLQINVSVNVGSTGRIAEQIAQTAISNGWDSYIAYGRCMAKSQSKVIKIGNQIDILYHVLITRLFDKHGFGSRIATRRLVKKIKEIKPDIIHLHNIHGYYLNFKKLFDFLAESKIPVVWTLHDCWSFTGHCAHFVNVGCKKWKTECFQCPLKHAYPKAFVDNSKRNFKLKKSLIDKVKGHLTIVPVSKWLASLAKSSYLHCCDQTTIYNGVDLSIFNEKSSSSSSSIVHASKYIIVGAATSWSESKGFYDYIKLREMLSNDITIVLIGVTPAQKSLLPQGVIGLDRTNSQSQLADIYRSADIVISLSRAETFGLTLAEGMACGVPVVAYNTTALPELITPETGMVVEQGNMEELKSAIMTVLNKGKVHYSKACRQRAEAYFDKNTCFKQYIDLYNEILANKNI